MSTLLALVVQDPAAGQVFANLVGRFTADEAARIYRAGVMDMCQVYADLNVRSRLLLYGPRGSRKRVGLMGSKRWRLIERKGPDRGETLIDLAERAFRGGHRRVVAIWPTAATLPHQAIVQAFDDLLVDDIVIGPTFGGDVYAVGFSVDMPHVFQGFDWDDSPAVFDRLVDRVDRLNLVMGLMPYWYSLDRAESLKVLASHLRAQLVADGHTTTPRLAEVVQRMVESHKPGAAGGT